MPTLIGLVQGAGRYLQSVANVEDSDVRVAKWLAERLPPLIREAGDEALADRTDVQTLSDQIDRLRSAIRDAPEPGEPTLHPLTPEMRKVLGG